MGSFPPNQFGLHDMLGNVWEWVEDCWTHSYNDAPTDGSAVWNRDCKWRVFRGGSWSNGILNVRASHRRNAGADTHRYNWADLVLERLNGLEFHRSYFGFRVAMTLN